MAGPTFTKINEGCTLTAKKDSRGWEIGYGCNRPDIVEGLVWTQEQADGQFEIDYASAEAHAIAVVGQEVWENLSSIRRAALIDAAYELGQAGLEQFHKMLAAIKINDWPIACQECLNSNYAENQVPLRAKRVAYMLLHDQWP